MARKSFLTNGCFACHDIPGLEDAKPIGPSLTGWGRKNTAAARLRACRRSMSRQQRAASGRCGTRTTRPGPTTADCAAAYFWEELQSQSRIGFIFQKLSEPRSFDFQDTQNKKYTARLRMPQFPLSAAQREAVMTFVLGLVSDPPTDSSRISPTRAREALIDGNEVLQQVSMSRLSRAGAGNLAARVSGGHLRRADARQTTYPFVAQPSR